jgi:hypothetical protein
VLPGAWAVRELVSMLGTVTDPRKQRGVRHQLATILAVAVFAVLAGAKTYRQVGDRVADLPQPLLALAGARSCPALGVVQAPSGSTIRRVLIAVDADAADRVVGSWLASLLDPDRSALLGLAMDGKTVRDAGTADGEVQLGAVALRLHVDQAPKNLHRESLRDSGELPCGTHSAPVTQYFVLFVAGGTRRRSFARRRFCGYRS